MSLNDQPVWRALRSSAGLSCHNLDRLNLLLASGFLFQRLVGRAVAAGVVAVCDQHTS